MPKELLLQVDFTDEKPLHTDKNSEFVMYDRLEDKWWIV